MSGEWKDGPLDDRCCCLPAMLCEVVPCHPDMGLRERDHPGNGAEEIQGERGAYLVGPFLVTQCCSLKGPHKCLVSNRPIRPDHMNVT